MNTENPFNKTPVPPSESSPDTSWVDMAEGNIEAAEQSEAAPSEDSLKATAEKFGVPPVPTTPSVEDAAALAAVNERLGIKTAESSTSELAEVSEAELQAMSPDQLREFTKQVSVEYKTLERKKSAARDALLESIRGPIKEQLEARLTQGTFSDYREQSTIQGVLSDIDNTSMFWSDIQRYWQGGASLLNSEIDIMPLLSDDVKKQIDTFYAEQEAMEEKSKPMLEKAHIANQLLREREAKAA